MIEKWYCPNCDFGKVEWRLSNPKGWGDEYFVGEGSDD